MSQEYKYQHPHKGDDDDDDDDDDNNNIFFQPAPSGRVFRQFPDQRIAFSREIRKLITLGHNQYIIQNKHSAVLNL